MDEIREEGTPKKFPIKIVAIAMVGIILVMVLYVIFVPKLVSRTTKHEAKATLDDVDYDISDRSVCVEWFLLFCTKSELRREVTATVDVTTYEDRGTFRIEMGLISNAPSGTDIYRVRDEYIPAHTNAIVIFEIEEFKISEEEHNSNYWMDVTVIPPTITETEEVTLFESWTS